MTFDPSLQRQENDRHREKEAEKQTSNLVVGVSKVS